MRQESFKFVPISGEVTNGEILRRCKTYLDALRMCIDISGKPAKVVAEELGLDSSQMTRMLGSNDADRRHLPHDFPENLMRICDNLIPLRWEALRFHYQIVPLESEKDRMIRERDRQIADMELKLQHFEEFMAMAGKK